MPAYLPGARIFLQRFSLRRTTSGSVDGRAVQGREGRCRPDETEGTAVILNLVLIGLAVALDPLPLTAFLVVLPSKRGTRKGAAYVFGWLVSMGVVVALTVLATGNNPPKPKTAPSLAALAVRSCSAPSWS